MQSCSAETWSLFRLDPLNDLLRSSYPFWFLHCAPLGIRTGSILKFERPWTWTCWFPAHSHFGRIWNLCPAPAFTHFHWVVTNSSEHLAVFLFLCSLCSTAGVSVHPCGLSKSARSFLVSNRSTVYNFSPFNLPILCPPCQLVMDPCAWLFLWFCFRWSCSPPMIQLAQMHYHGPWLTASTVPNIWGAKSVWRRDSWHLVTTQDIMIMSQTKDQASKYQKTMKASKFSRLKHFTWVCGIKHFELYCKAGLWMPVSCGRRVFPFGVETKIAGGTGSHLTGPGRAGCKLLVKTYGNPSSRAACNGCLDGDGLGEFGYHPQALWLLKQTQETQKNVRHYSQIKKCTVELFNRTIDLLESCKSSHSNYTVP